MKFYQNHMSALAVNVSMDKGKASSLMQVLLDLINNVNLGDNLIRSKIWIPNSYRILTASLTSVECRSWIIRSNKFLKYISYSIDPIKRSFNKKFKGYLVAFHPVTCEGPIHGLWFFLLASRSAYYDHMKILHFSHKRIMIFMHYFFAVFFFIPSFE